MRILYVTAATIDRYLVKALREFGHTVETAGDIADGLVLARTGGWQAIVCDAAAPVDDAARRFATACPGTPLIMIAAADNRQERIEAFRQGADACFTRPYGMAEIGAKLDALARQAVRAAAKPAPATVLSLEPAGRMALLSGVRIALSRHEYALLALLMQHAGEVLAIERILEAVWSDNEDPRPELVRNHVSRLRAKLERASGRRFLHAVRGHGYCFRFEAAEAVPASAAGPPGV